LCRGWNCKPQDEEDDKCKYAKHPLKHGFPREERAVKIRLPAQNPNPVFENVLAAPRYFNARFYRTDKREIKPLWLYGLPAFSD
jgi:hypothetical protein